MIDFTAAILDIDGKSLPSAPGSDDPMTLRHVCVNALLGVAMPPDAGGMEKVRIGLMAEAIYNGEANLTADDIALLKKQIGCAYGPLVVMRAWALLDPASVRP